MAELPPQTRPPFQAGNGRRVFHTLLATAGWILFVWWWWLVFQRVSEREIRFTLLFITIALVAIVGLTAIWALHNVRIFRRRGARTHLRESGPDPVLDSVGRPVRLPSLPESCRTATVVTVRIEGADKHYLPEVAGGPHGAPGGPTP